MPNTKRSWIIFFVGIGLTLIAAGISPLWVAYAQETTPVPTETSPQPLYESQAPQEVTGSNSYCLVCHNQPWRTVTFHDGTIQNLYVDPDTIAASVHGTGSSTGTFGCVDCHGQDSFPHNDPSPADDRAYTLYSVAICAACHTEQVTELEQGLHEEAILAGNDEAAVCTDCHGAHDVRPIVEQPELIAGVCGECHQNTLVEWRGSAHVDIEPLGCATCHSPHSQRLRAGNTPDELCTNCHKQDEVTTVFVHNQHLTPDSSVACTDCHMYTGEPHDGEAVLAANERQSTGHSMLMNAAPCNTCHEELVLSGEWDQIIANRAAEVTSPEVVMTAVPEAAVDEAVAASGTISYVQLLQGLILGLGFGVTFATVFIARGNRSRSAEAAPVSHVPSPSDVEQETSTPPEVKREDEGDKS